MNLRNLAAAAAFSLAVTAPLALENDPIPLVLTPISAGTLGTSFERAVTGLFVDTFTFTPATFAGDVSVSFTSLSGPVNFYAALLNGEGFSFLPENGQAAFAFRTTVTGNMPLQLTLLGFSGNAATLTEASGAYRGTITAAIPEPETYALMLAGLAAVGAVVRRQTRRARAAA